jgi:uncharacterized membrane protein YphA (DoxX/SURF4 family)
MMEAKTTGVFQLFLRIAIAITFLSAVADRFGLWGNPGSTSVAWGNWENFVGYSNAVNSFSPPKLGKFLAILATLLEVILPVLLLVGYKIRAASVAAGLLLLLFALAMTYSFGIKPSLDYSVWTASAACFLLSAIKEYRYSVDRLIARERKDASNK